MRKSNQLCTKGHALASQYKKEMFSLSRQIMCRKKVTFLQDTNVKFTTALPLNIPQSTYQCICPRILGSSKYEIEQITM